MANALSLDVPAIRKKRHLLEGVCKEAVELLRNRRIVEDTDLREVSIDEASPAPDGVATGS